jgi:hypothetical protein
LVHFPLDIRAGYHFGVLQSGVSSLRCTASVWMRARRQSPLTLPLRTTPSTARRHGHSYHIAQRAEQQVALGPCPGGHAVGAYGRRTPDRQLFELVASEMWESEARQLSVDDLRTYTELVSENFGLDSDQAAQLATKVTSYAGFRPRRGEPYGPTSFAFEHEVYFDYFLARAVQRMLREQRFDELGVFLNRGVIPETVAPGAIRSLEQLDPTLLRCSAAIPFENRRRNLGALLLAFATKVGPVSDTTVRGLSFIGAASGTARFDRVAFDNCEFFGTDLRGAVFVDCDGATATFRGVKLDDDSQMAIRGLRPGDNVGSTMDRRVMCMRQTRCGQFSNALEPHSKRTRLCLQSTPTRRRTLLLYLIALSEPTDGPICCMRRIVASGRCFAHQVGLN